MTWVASEVGYPDTSVDLVLAGTDIARSTFYEHFRDLGVCFEESLRLAGEELVARVDEHPSQERATCGSLVGTLMRFCQEEPAAAGVLFCESLAGGPRARRIRGSLAGELEARLLQAWETEGDPPEVVGRPDLAAIIFRLLALDLRGAGGAPDLEVALQSWTRIYRRRPAWVPGEGVIDLLPSTVLSFFGAHGTGADRGRLVGEALVQRQRARILGAVLEVAAANGYAAATVAAINAGAGVSRKTFYELFAGREEAAVLAAEGVFQACMTCAAGAFFSQEAWPERIWEGGRALLSFIAAFPTAAYYGFVEAPSISRAAAAMVDARLAAFTLFLEQGYRLAPTGSVPQATSQVLMAAMFEFAYQDLCEQRSGDELLGRLPEFVYLILAPFLGEEAAAEFVAGKLAGR